MIEEKYDAGTLARELVRRREDVHLSQRRLGELADVSNTLISAIEAGAAPPQHPSYLLKIARGLSTSGSGNVNERQSESHYRALMIAAGYCPREQVIAPIDPEAVLAELARDPEIAALLASVARKYPTLSSDQRAFLTVGLQALQRA